MSRLLSASARSVIENEDLKEPELHVIGELLGGSNFDRDNAFCLFEMKTGPHWTCVGGQEAGQTQVDYPEEEDVAGGMYVWNHPIDVHYYAKTMEGWPKIVFEVWGLNDYGMKALIGYGYCNVPTSPGSHEVDVSIWRPCGDLQEEIHGFFLEENPHLLNVDLLYHPVKAKDERNRLYTTAVGKVHLRLDIVLRNLAEHSIRAV